MMHFITKMLVALMIGFVTAGASANGDLKILDPWVQAAPPGVKVLAAYLEIHNAGTKECVLTGVSSTAFGHVGIHRSVMHGDMAHMESLDTLTIPARASVAFQPGGLHLMLTDARMPLREGVQVPMTLTFSNGEKISVTAIVRSGKPGGMDDHQHMDHSGHGGHKH